MKNAAVFEDAFNLLCGETLGYGMSRTVYATDLKPNCVVKVEKDAHRFQNVVEWEVWNAVEFTPAAKWFAPCLWISPNGRVLIQRRTFGLLPSAYPKQLPAFLTDTKRSNFGVLHDGRFVCHDYGLLGVVVSNGLSEKLRSVRWHE